MDPFREQELAWALDGLAPGRLLELGCGAGNVTRALVERGFAVTGLDISEAAIAWARDRAGDCARFIVGDAVTAIPGEYDLIVDGHCLHCIIGKDRQQLLGNVRNALAANGTFFVSTMCGEITHPPLRATFDPASRCQIVGGIARRFIGDAGELLDELRTAGFEVVRSTIRHRENAEDQDHLWALMVRR